MNNKYSKNLPVSMTTCEEYGMKGLCGKECPDFGSKYECGDDEELYEEKTKGEKE